MKTKKIEKLIKKAQKALKLASYRIKYNINEMADHSIYAEIGYQHPKRTAIINFNRKTLNQQLKDTIIHELLHLFFSKYIRVAENAFERQRKYKSLKKYQKGEEKIIDILAPLLEKAIFAKKKKCIIAKEQSNLNLLHF